MDNGKAYLPDAFERKYPNAAEKTLNQAEIVKYTTACALKCNLAHIVL